MPGFAEQLQAARAAHTAASALEASARQQIIDAFESWDAGDLTSQTVRHRLEAIIRSAYRMSASVAIEHTVTQSKLPKWRPKGTVYRTEYLDSLLADVRRNLREYKASERTEADLRRYRLRMQHSAGVGAQRGYTDALIESYAELENLGYDLRKVWMANFVNNTPCPICRGLHGTSVGLREEFKVKASDKTKIYLNLQGPPRHPRCQCWLAILVVDLENLGEELDVDEPENRPARRTMTTDDVKRLPQKIYASILSSLKAIRNFFGGRRAQ